MQVTISLNDSELDWINQYLQKQVMLVSIERVGLEANRLR